MNSSVSLHTLIWTRVAMSAVIALSSGLSRADVMSQQIAGDEADFLISQLETTLKTGGRFSQQNSTLSESEWIRASLRLADLKSDRARQLEVKSTACAEEALENSRKTKQKSEADLEIAKRTGECRSLAIRAKSDRETSRTIYRELESLFERKLKKNGPGQDEAVLSESDLKSYTNILLQLALIEDQINNPAAAEEIYLRLAERKIGGRKFPARERAIALTALGEKQMQKKQFKKAEGYLKDALAIESAPRRGWILNRLAWTQLSLNQTETAKKTFKSLLSSDELLRLDQSEVDEGFKADVATDLGLLYADSGVTLSEMQWLWNLAPQSERLDLFLQMGQEAERLGHSERALLFYGFVGSAKDSGLDRNDSKLISLVRMAQASWTARKYAQAADYSVLASNWLKKNSCKDQARCDEALKMFHDLVRDWVRIEETDERFSKALNETLVAFLKADDQNLEFAVWIQSLQLSRVQPSRQSQGGSGSSSKLKGKSEQNLGSSDPLDQVRQLTTLVRQNYKNIKSKSAVYGKRDQVLESSLLMGVDAEIKAKSSEAAQIAAIETYLADSKLKTKAAELTLEKGRKQIALGKRQQAFETFSDLLEDEKQCPKNEKICLEAAHLSLDQLKVLGETYELAQSAKENFKTFKKDEFKVIHIESLLALAEKSIADSKAVKVGDKKLVSDLEESEELGQSGIESKLRARSLTARFQLAVRASSQESAKTALTRLKKEFKSQNDLQLAEFDFAYAKKFGSKPEIYQAFKDLVLVQSNETSQAGALAKTKKSSDLQDQLVLAQLAEDVAKEIGAQSRPASVWRQRQSEHLKSALKEKLGESQELGIRIRLVQLAENPVSEYRAQAQHLSSSPSDLATAMLDVWARVQSPEARALLESDFKKYPAVLKTSVGQAIVREIHFTAIHRHLHDEARDVLESRIESKAKPEQVAKSILNQVNRLEDYESKGSRLVKTGDVLSGWVTASVVAVGQKHLHDDVRGLSVPKGLTPAQTNQYRTALAQKAHPFLVKSLKAQDILKKYESAGFRPQSEVSVLSGLKDAERAPWREAVVRRQIDLIEDGISIAKQGLRLGSLESGKRKQRGS